MRMGVFLRHRKLWLRFKDETGKWKNAPTPYTAGEEALAEKAHRALTDRITAKLRALEGKPQPLTVRVYAARWIKQRRDLGVGSVRDDETRLTRHALPVIGDLLLCLLYTSPSPRDS